MELKIALRNAIRRHVEIYACVTSRPQDLIFFMLKRRNLE